MPKDNIRYVNRTRGVLRFPTPRGSRMALAPGEWTTEKYYERFARLITQSNPGGKRPLVMEYPDGTPVGVDELPESQGVVAPRPVVATAPPTPQAPPPTGCATACEAGCQFPTEANPVVEDEINAAMDRDAAPPLPETQPADSEASAPEAATEMPAAAPTPAETMQTVEPQMEPGIAPPMPATAPADAPAETLPPSPTPTPETDAPPPPQVNEGVQGRASVAQVMEHFNLDDQQILETNEDYMKVLIDEKETYVSRLQLGWFTEHLTAMKTHVTKLTNPV